jgi:hypothetical protein
MTEEVKKKKKPVNGKAKGSGFELNISKLLGKALAPIQFKRSQGSGNVVGGLNVKHVEKFSKEILRVFVGDVCPINESECEKKFRFVVECKFYKERENITAILNGKSSIYAWMNEARVDAAKLDLEPILIFKYNNTPIFCCINKDTAIPLEVVHFKLTNGDVVCEFEELLKHSDFWLI